MFHEPWGGAANLFETVLEQYEDSYKTTLQTAKSFLQSVWAFPAVDTERSWEARQEL